MISPEKLAANQANAQNSTGPKTPEGKATSAQNSRTHGLYSNDLLVANEDKDEFNTMHLKLEVDIRPQGALEQILFTELVIASWQLRRIGRMETELSAGHESYTALLDDEILQKKLDRLGRNHTRFERTFHRCLKELKALQTNRTLKEEAVENNDGRRTSTPALAHVIAAKTKISKRTQPAAEPEPYEMMTDQENDEMQDYFQKMEEIVRNANQKIADKAA
jgi:hypothetical protein